MKKNRGDKTPEGAWRFMWSHMTYQMKEMFYQTFQKGQPHSTESSRFDVKTWLRSFKYYLKLLDNGTMGRQDPMSVEIYPTRPKKISKITYITCKLCLNEVDEEKCTDGYCNECLKKGESYHCAGCGKTMVYTNHQKYIKQSPRYKYCRQCHDERSRKNTSSDNYYSNIMRDFNSWSKTANKDNSSKSGGCFITMAVCEYYGLPVS